MLQSLLGYLAMDSQRRPLLIQVSFVWSSVPTISQDHFLVGRRGITFLPGMEGKQVGLSEEAGVVLSARR